MSIHLLSVGLGLALGTSVVVFLIIILLFVALLLGVRAKLMPKGDVVININGGFWQGVFPVGYPENCRI